METEMIERIYEKSPIWMQNILVAASGLQL